MLMGVPSVQTISGRDASIVMKCPETPLGGEWVVWFSIWANHSEGVLGTSVPPSEHQLHVSLEHAHEICRFDEVDRLYSKISGGQDSPSAHVIYSSFPIPATRRINIGGGGCDDAETNDMFVWHRIRASE